MIPSIDEIVEGLAAGEVSKEQAIAWLEQHASTAAAGIEAAEFRDAAALAAIEGLVASQGTAGDFEPGRLSRVAFAFADAMVAERARRLANKG